MNDLSESFQSGVALLVDGENLSSKFAGRLISQSLKYGSLTIKRIYGDASLLNGWNDAPCFRVVHSGTGKNAADILLAIEAIDLSYSRRIGTFVLASSDGDFSHIAHRLREAGFRVIGVGEAKAGERFRKACTHFHEVKLPTAEATRLGLSELDAQIYDVIICGTGQRNIPIASLSALMHRRFEVRISSRPEKTWRRYLTSKPDLYRCDDKGPNARVHLLA